VALSHEAPAWLSQSSSQLLASLRILCCHSDTILSWLVWVCSPDKWTVTHYFPVRYKTASSVPALYHLSFLCEGTSSARRPVSGQMQADPPSRSAMTAATYECATWHPVRRASRTDCSSGRISAWEEIYVACNVADSSGCASCGRTRARHSPNVCRTGSNRLARMMPACGTDALTDPFV
jgi:hypothetical protein